MDAISTRCTQGRLTAQGDVIFYLLAGTEGADVVAIGIDNQADARRLVACWNACDGFDTDLLISIDTMGDTLAQRFHGLRAEFDVQQAKPAAARALLVDIDRDIIADREGDVVVIMHRRAGNAQHSAGQAVSRAEIESTRGSIDPVMTACRHVYERLQDSIAIPA
jgi:hypothetical protein